MLRYDNKTILFNEDAYKKSSLFKKIRAWWWDSWFYSELYQYSWLYNLRWHVTHWWRNDHWVKTNLPIGYHDNPQLMEDAIFSLVENYIAADQEDAFNNVVIEGEERETIIEILHYYRVLKPELEKHYDDMLNEAFGDDCDWKFTPCPDHPGFSSMDTSYTGDLTVDQRKDIITYVHKMEEYIYIKTQEMLKKCIDIRMILWT